MVASLMMLSTRNLGALVSPGVLALALFVPGSAEAGQPTNASPSRQLRVVRITQLTNDVPFYRQPVWSPDGQWLAFGLEGASGIEVVRPDGTGRKTLTRDPGSGYKFAWSPDSRQIAYRASQYLSNSTTHIVKTVEAASGRIVELGPPAGEVQPPVWSRSNASHRVSFIVDTNRLDTAWRTLKGKPARAAARNDGLLLYSDRAQLWSCDADGLGRKQLTEAGGMEPVWSPDRSRIVYSQMDTLMIMEPDGSNKRVLTKGHHPSWSPDGRRLVYDVSTDDGHQILNSDIWMINADGTLPMPLTDTPKVLESEPAWSPDGQCIACRTEHAGRVLLLWLE